MYRPFTFFAVLLLAVMLQISGQTAYAGSQDEAVQAIADQVKQYLASKGENAIAIGSFNGPRTGTGRALETRLAEILKADGISIVDQIDAKWEVRGNFAIHNSGKMALISLTVSLFDTNGTEISEFRQRFEEATAAERELVNELNTPEENTSSTETVASTTNPSTTPPADNKSTVASPAATTGNKSTESPKVVSNSPQSATGNSSSASTASNSSATSISQGVPIDNPTDVAILSGVTADLQTAVESATGVRPSVPNGPPEPVNSDIRSKARNARDTALKQAISTAQFHQVGPTVVAASSSSRFHIEVLVARNQGAPFEPMPIETRGGFPFVPMTEGNLYRVRIHNNSDIDVGVELLIDGINTLHFAENPAIKESGKWVVTARSVVDIQGWFVNQGTVDTFLITSVPEGVASQLGRPQRIGNITAVFFPAWEGNDVPAFEQLLAAGRSRGATGRGPSDSFRGRIVTRHFGTQPLSIVSLRYKNPPPPADLPTDSPAP